MLPCVGKEWINIYKCIILYFINVRLKLLLISFPFQHTLYQICYIFNNSVIKNKTKRNIGDYFVMSSSIVSEI